MAEDENENDGATRVDLGDDLLEKTAVLELPRISGVPYSRSTGTLAPSGDAGDATRALNPAATPSYGSFTQTPQTHDSGPSMPIAPQRIPLDEIADHLHSARILLDEGLVEEAKKLLRRILVADSGSVHARKMIAEIHEIELRQLFGDESRTRRRYRRDQQEEPDLSGISADTVMRGLDRELRLGLFSEEMGESYTSQLSLFQDSEAMEAFAAKLDRDLSGVAVRDRVDIGIGFIEMGLYDIAVRQFKAACNRLASSGIEGPEAQLDLLSATSLLAYALILAGRPFEATLTVQPLISDTEIPREPKVELFYLMGRACEALRKREEALRWYHQLREIDPTYRDVEERIRR